MKASLQWIREILPRLPADAARVAQRLTDAGLEVESTHDQAAAFASLVAVEIRAIEPHPNADKLRLVTVWDGKAEHRIVCGAPHLELNSKVPLAKLGAKLPGGLVIAAREIRGVPSEGMLCSASELGLSHSGAPSLPKDGSGLYLLPPKTKPGRPLAEVLGQTDVIFDIAPPANRADLLSHHGLARELAALFDLDQPTTKTKVKESKTKAQATVEIAATDRCPRYLGRVIEGVAVGPSPAPVVQRLAALGIRSISNVVDATNLVLMELGHPLHAFDLDKLAEGRVIVRRATEGEALTTLDGVARTLSADDLVIADAARPIALAGVMGGGDSEVGPGTTRILLESAHFEARGVRRTGKRHGLHTEASHRFERGTDPDMVEVALDRCAQLIVELAGGAVSKGVISAGRGRSKPVVASIRPERATAFLGRPVDRAEIRRTLGALGLTKAEAPRASKAKASKGAKAGKKGEGALHFEVPSWRADLSREVDLIEELARIAGFGLIPTVLPGAGGAVRAQPAPLDPLDDVRRALVAEGYHEAISLAFASPSQLQAIGLDQASAVVVANPLGEESALLRPSLLPALLKATRHNQAMSRTDVRLFEVGRSFRWSPLNPADGVASADGLPEETSRAAIVLRGRRGAAGWWGGNEQADVFDLKGAVEAVLEAFGIEATFAALSRPWLHPRSAGEIRGPGGAVLGELGELHPDVAQRLDLDGPPVFVAELSVDALAAARGAVRKMRPLPRFPAVARDLSFFVGRAVPAGELLATVRQAAGAALEEVRLFDVYEGKGVPDGERSVAVTMAFRALDRTLTDAEVDAAQGAVIAALEGTHQARVRQA